MRHHGEAPVFCRLNLPLDTPAVLGHHSALAPGPPPGRFTISKPMSQYFPNIDRIAYEGPKSRNPLAYKHYNPEEVVEGKKMKDHLRFSVVYWHTMCGQ